MELNKQLLLVFQVMEKHNRITFEDIIYVCYDNEIFHSSEELTAEEIRPLVIDEAELSSLDLSIYNIADDDFNIMSHSFENGPVTAVKTGSETIRVFSYKNSEGKVSFLPASDIRFKQMLAKAEKLLLNFLG